MICQYFFLKFLKGKSFTNQLRRAIPLPFGRKVVELNHPLCLRFLSALRVPLPYILIIPHRDANVKGFRDKKLHKLKHKIRSGFCASCPIFKIRALGTKNGAPKQKEGLPPLTFYLHRFPVENPNLQNHYCLHSCKTKQTFLLLQCDRKYF